MRPPTAAAAAVVGRSQEATAFAPATVANLGPGFDYLGVAVEGQGDVVTATARPDLPGQVMIESIEGKAGKPP